MAPALAVEDVTVTYGAASARAADGMSFTAVRDVRFEVEAGTTTVLIGPSGCGKTTILLTIAGFLRPSRGHVTLGDERARVEGPGPDRAVVFQDFDQLFPWRTLRSNVMYALMRTRRMTPAAAQEEAEKYLLLVGIAAAADRFPHELSGGMKQRGAIARALSLRPGIVLMDEPFGALDAITRAQLQDEVVRIKRIERLTTVLVTHSIEEAALLGDEVLVMATDPGRIVARIDCSHVSDRDTSDFQLAAAQLRLALAAGDHDA